MTHRILPPFDVITRLLLAPILLWQGLALRRRSLDLPEAAGARAGQTGSGAPLSLFVLGDSSAAGVGVAHQNDALLGQLVAKLSTTRKVIWGLDAQTGRTTTQMLERLEQLERFQCDVSVIALGVNDVIRFASPQHFREQHKAVRQTLRDRFGARQIIVTDLPPIRLFPAFPALLAWVLGAHAERLSRALLEDCQSESDVEVVTLDLPPDSGLIAEDGYHPSAKTYNIWADIVARQV